MSDILLIRHAPAVDGGMLAGRRDIAADTGDAAALARVRARVGIAARLVVSPALRCRQTCAALWPEARAVADPRLWEQHFGAWEGVAYADLPDLGAIDAAALADHAPPDGESFADQCRRVAPALDDLGHRPGRTVVVAHAGTIRAALAHVLGAPGPALAFRIDPLSVTRLIPGAGGWAIGGVNQC
jgi:alpha-ribazole phosphatase